MFSQLIKRVIPSILNRGILAHSFSTASKAASKMPDKLIWVDCEMTGLDIEKDRLLEIAAIITDDKLEHLDSFGPVCIGQPKEVLENMNEWCVKMFAKNGLTERCMQSEITIEEADEMLSTFLFKNGIVSNGIIAGNSIPTDRIFLDKFCKKFTSQLHYRMVDVSSIKILAKMWYNDATRYNKDTEHRALSDIQQSIEELKYYRDNYFVKLDVEENSADGQSLNGKSQ